MAMLGEAIVHGEDIRRPLGSHRSYPIQTITRVAEYYRGSDQVVLAKGRITGLRLAATDGPFTVTVTVTDPGHRLPRVIRGPAAREIRQRRAR